MTNTAMSSDTSHIKPLHKPLHTPQHITARKNVPNDYLLEGVGKIDVFTLVEIRYDVAGRFFYL